jgi:hypothetical protein
MVSLKELPYEFVFLRKEPSFSVNLASIGPISAHQSANSSLQFPSKPAAITRFPKPAVPSPYLKLGKYRICRSIRLKVNSSSFVHHEHRQNATFRERDWKATYDAAVGRKCKYPYGTNRAKMLQNAEGMLRSSTSRIMLRYDKCKKRGNEGKLG